ncbi:Swt1 family HEPN domain-containing protein [Sphingomonas sp. PB4P5]|uniref:Swt1 family HEPN domain-containing protein n=1 Tax=Parasphingomonas puruogangriensis TaxID=3096155 RepID=UPI002FC8BA13
MTSAALRDFIFRGMLFDAEAEQFRKAGIRIGLDRSESEEALLLEALSQFGIKRRNDALEMARLYAVLHAFENEIRRLVRDTFDENVQGSWWDGDTIPKRIRDKAESRRKTALDDSWLEGGKDDNLEYVDFGDLSQIVIANWDFFKEIIPSQSWLNQIMVELEKARNFVAHNRMLLPNEFQRIYMYISDWNKTVGI